MQADPDERLTDDTGRSGPPMVPILAGIVILVALGVWVFTGGEEEPVAPEPAPQVQPEPEPAPEPLPEPEPTPDIPEPEPAPEPAPAAEPEEPLPSLAESDEPLREELTAATGFPLLETALAADNLAERGVAVVDAVSLGGIRHKLLPLPPPEGKFPVRKVDSQAVMDEAGYRRYDPYAEAIAEVDALELVAAFNRYRPLLEEAYSMLGYEAEDFDNAVIRALDKIIAAPVIEQPLEVRKVEAVYKYENPALEKLPPLHKQLLRAGPENTRRIQQKARELRAALLVQ